MLAPKGAHGARSQHSHVREKECTTNLGHICGIEDQHFHCGNVHSHFILLTGTLAVAKIRYQIWYQGDARADDLVKIHVLLLAYEMRASFHFSAGGRCIWSLLDRVLPHDTPRHLVHHIVLKDIQEFSDWHEHSLSSVQASLQATRRLPCHSCLIHFPPWFSLSRPSTVWQLMSQVKLSDPWESLGFSMPSPSKLVMGILVHVLRRGSRVGRYFLQISFQVWYRSCVLYPCTGPSWRKSWHFNSVMLDYSHDPI